MKRQSVILSFNLPSLTDQAAAQLVDLLHQIIDGVEYHYVEHVHRHQKRQQSNRRAPSARPPGPDDPPY